MSVDKYAMEFIGTFFLVLAIGMSVMEPGGAGALAPVAFSLTLVALVYMGGHVSGAHYNPAVTLSFLLRGRFASRDVAPYVIVQCLAAVAAAVLVPFLKGSPDVVPLEPTVVPALLSEFVFTFLLCFVILNVATAKSTEGNQYYGVAIGATVLGGAYAVGSISGAAFNPAVALGLGLMGLVGWADLWIHLVGDFAGAVAAAFAFKAFVGG